MSKGRCWEVTFTYEERQMVHLLRTNANRRGMGRDAVKKVGSDVVMRAWAQGKEGT